jgi:hypothetical protein
MLSSKQTGVVIAVKSLLPIRNKRSTLKDEVLVLFRFAMLVPLVKSPNLIDVCSRVRSKLAQLVSGFTHV